MTINTTSKATKKLNKIDKIRVRGARQHNLKSVDLDIPKNKLIVFTGVSGSGKSSLAYDTIYAEGQRRYVESLSTYARQFLGIMEKPNVDVIEGLSPAISIDQKAASKNPRSTVGTVTEVYDYLRLLYARVGHPHCPVCNREISSQSSDQIVRAIMNHITDLTNKSSQTRIAILAPVVRDKKGEFNSLFINLKAKGYKQVRIDGVTKNLDEDFVILKTNKHSIEVFVDKLSITKKDIRKEVLINSIKSRLTDSVEQSVELSGGLVILTEILDSDFEIPQKPKMFSDHLYSEHFACPIDNIQIPEIAPRTFSFNSPHGACKKCAGLGRILKVSPDMVFSSQLTITEGGILPFKNMFEHDTWFSRLVLAVCKEHDINPKSLIRTYSKKQLEILLYGTGSYEHRVEGKNRFGKDTYIYEVFRGIVGELERRHKNTESDWVRTEVEKYMLEAVCEDCDGKRLNKEALSVTISGKSISEICMLSIKDTLNWVTTLSKPNSIFSSKELKIAGFVLKEILTRLQFLSSIGLEYLTLSRRASTLSSGESQRIRLASQIGSGLSGVLYVLDEPTIGLHMRDNQKLIDTLKNLRDLGNTVVVVEHDEDMIKQADYVFDFGPGAGKQGGTIIAFGTPKQIANNRKSITGSYLNGNKKIIIAPVSQKHPNGEKKTLSIRGCNQFNLKDLNIDFPLNNLIVITGVSGSGKSTLLVETLYPALMTNINNLFKGTPGEYKTLKGIENIDKAILINQSPIGRTPRSNPATYTKMFDYIREVYANTHDARTMGFKKGRFSFNVKGGRCEACEGQGQNKIEMQFMSDIWVECDICHGLRYNAQTLEIKYRGKNISDVLKMTVTEATEFFHAHRNIVSKLETLKAVGLGYMELGQPATTLSGGEAQRIKLSSELAKRETGKTVYILDEPTTGLHFKDIEKLLSVLRLLVKRGNTVIVIEHNMDIIRNADWIIDLGPEGGEAGGQLVFSGKVSELKKSVKSHTAKYL